MPKYEGGLVSLERVENEKDVGVTINSKLKFDEHIQNQVNKANKMMGLVRRSFKFLDIRSFRLLFKSIVIPHLQYASSVWSPSKIKDIDSIENVQRRATKMLPKLKDKSYEERLKLIKLPTLKFRRLRGDMIETYKILNNIYDKRTTVGIFTLNTNTNRGHPLKLLKQRCARDIRKNFFSNRIVNIWNNLPSAVVTSKNTDTFKRRLDKYWINHPMVYDHNCDYNEITGGKTPRLLNSDDEEEATTEVQKTCGGKPPKVT